MGNKVGHMVIPGKYLNLKAQGSYVEVWNWTVGNTDIPCFFKALHHFALTEDLN